MHNETFRGDSVFLSQKKIRSKTGFCRFSLFSYHLFTLTNVKYAFNAGSTLQKWTVTVLQQTFAKPCLTLDSVGKLPTDIL